MASVYPLLTSHCPCMIVTLRTGSRRGAERADAPTGLRTNEALLGSGFYDGDAR